MLIFLFCLSNQREASNLSRLLSSSLLPAWKTNYMSAHFTPQILFLFFFYFVSFDDAAKHMQKKPNTQMMGCGLNMFIKVLTVNRPDRACVTSKHE